MKCPLTGKPCVKLKYIGYVDGKTEHLVCEDCIHQTQSQDKIKTPDDEETCADCGATLSEMVKGSRFGCARCYENFSETVGYIIASLQGGGHDIRHVGSVPHGFLMERARETTREGFLAELGEDLNNAIASEDYERAAAIRTDMNKIRDELLSDEEFVLFVFERRLEGLK